MKTGFAFERLLPLAALGGAALLIGSQFLSVFELRSAGDVLQATVSGADQHWFSMALFGLLAAASVIGAIATGSRPLAVTVAVCGLVALLLFLLIDLPDAGRSDSVNTTVGALVIAEAHPAGGFWIELIGALVLTVCGGAMATLTGEQLRELAPRRFRIGEGQGVRKRGSNPSAPEAQSSSQRDSNPSKRSVRADKKQGKPKPKIEEPDAADDGLSAEELREKRRKERRAARQAEEA